VVGCSTVRCSVHGVGLWCLAGVMWRVVSVWYGTGMVWCEVVWWNVECGMCGVEVMCKVARRGVVWCEEMPVLCDAVCMCDVVGWRCFGSAVWCGVVRM
jgi:hypothetical protein